MCIFNECLHCKKAKLELVSLNCCLRPFSCSKRVYYLQFLTTPNKVISRDFIVIHQEIAYRIKLDFEFSKGKGLRRSETLLIWISVRVMIASRNSVKIN